MRLWQTMTALLYLNLVPASASNPKTKPVLNQHQVHLDSSLQVYGLPGANLDGLGFDGSPLATFITRLSQEAHACQITTRPLDLLHSGLSPSKPTNS